jgi:tripartite-type tricarboxylate transporter receptor subunit TctC
MVQAFVPRFSASVVLAAVAAFASSAIAQQYPIRPVRVIVPFAPGGGSDLTARPISQRLSEALGQQFVVDNRGGAAGRPRAVNRGLRNVEQGPACGMRP